MICDLCGQEIVSMDDSHICSTTALCRQENPNKEPSFSERLAFGFAMDSDDDVAGANGYAA